MEYTKKITLDVNAENRYVIVPMKQGDAKLRKLEINLVSNGAAFSTSGVSEALFRVQKPDGHSVVQSTKDTTNPITASGAVYTVPLVAQALVAAGRAYCDLTLLDSSGGILSSNAIIMDIVPMPDVANLIESSDSWERLMKALETAENIGAEIKFRESTDKASIEYSTNGGETWRIMCPVADIIQAISDSEIDELFD